jgi:hypothetical protein
MLQMQGNGVVLIDSKFTRPEYLKSPSYRAAIGQIKTLANNLKIEIIPRVFDLGYAGGLLSGDVLYLDWGFFKIGRFFE